MKSRKVCVALAAHPRAPRHLALRLIRQFYTFDLMRFTLQPSVAADLRHVAEEQLIARLPSVTLGERLALARRGSQVVASALLLDKESPVARIALENPRLTEAAVVKALMRPNSPAAFVELVCHHTKWSVRREIRMALLRSPAHSTGARTGVCQHASTAASARHPAHITITGEDQGVSAEQSEGEKIGFSPRDGATARRRSEEWRRLYKKPRGRAATTRPRLLRAVCPPFPSEWSKPIAPAGLERRWLHAARFRSAGSNRVHPNSLGGNFPRQPNCEAIDCTLRCRVVNPLSGGASVGCAGRYIHDRAAGAAVLG